MAKGASVDRPWASADLSVVPLDRGVHVGEAVAAAVAALRADPELVVEPGPTGTALEGPLARVLTAVERAIVAVAAERCYAVVKLDVWSRPRPGELARKRRRIEA